MMNRYVFENGEVLDMTGFKGCFIDKDIEKHFGREIADRIWQENPYNRISKKLVEKYCSEEELKE